MAVISTPPDESGGNDTAGTLGELLYADETKTRIPEKDWVALVQSIAAGDQRALNALYERSHRLVFTLMMRITHDRESAEELTLDVFHDVWRHAREYDVASGSVLGWIVDQARSGAIDRLHYEQRKTRVSRHTDGPERHVLRDALTLLTEQERQAIETAYFGALTDVAVAARLDQPPGTVKTHICSGLRKLRAGARPRSEGALNAADQYGCAQVERVAVYALHALPLSELGGMEAHISACLDCQHELDTLRPIIESFVFWPTDLLRPSVSLRQRLAQRIATETAKEPVVPATQEWSEPEWEVVASGISCKLLANDTERQRASMLVRLAPGIAYPPHIHAGVEELHLLHGELWIDGRKLYPGDYNRAEAGTADQRVWSETGCTCILITSPEDVLR